MTNLEEVPPARAADTGRLSPNFRISEFSVSASRPDLVRPIPAAYFPAVETLAREILQPIRDHVAAPVTILSGYRSAALNRAIGGSPTSQHLRAEAADFTTAKLRGLFRDLVARTLLVPCGQCIYYPSRQFVHVAIPSAKYPQPSFHVHEPSAGLSYHRVRSLRELDDVLRGL